MSGHPLVPGEPAYDVTVHIVLDDFGGRLGRAYCETGEGEGDEKTIIENMIRGEYSRPRYDEAPRRCSARVWGSPRTSGGLPVRHVST